MKTVFSLILLWVFLVPSAPAVAVHNDSSAEQVRPVSEQELYMMLATRGAFSPQQIADVVRGRGIDFRLTDSMRKSLRKAGANDVVMSALEKAYNDLKHRGSETEQATPVASSLSTIPAPPPPTLSQEAAAELIEKVRRNALAYTDGLPNFLCLEVTKRMYDGSGNGYWQTADTIHTKVAFSDHHESYQVFMVNNTVVDRKLESLGGAVSTGEFGSMLHELFVPEAEADFRLVAPASFNGRPVYAFEYRVTKEHSKWQLLWEPHTAGEQRFVPGYHGSVIIDADTAQVLRMWLVADGIPADFPIRSAITTLDYDWAKIADVPYLLPARAIVEMTDSRYHTRNEIAFRGYRKFSTETNVTFGDVPDDIAAKPEPVGQPTTPPSTGKQPPAPVKKK